MSRPTYAPKETKLGDGSVAAYTFSFKITALEQLEIIEVDNLGVETQRVLGTDVTYLSGVVFDAVDGGGTVTLAANLTDQYNLIILLANDAPTQDYEFRNKTSFTLKRFENALDEILGSCQRLTYRGKQGLRIHDLDDEDTFDSQFPPNVATDGADTVLQVNAAGTGLEFGPTASSVAGANASAIAAAASAAAALVSELAAAADLVLTNADVVLTGLDVTSTNADVVTTNADVVLTGLDLAATNLDVIAAALSETNADADATQTALDRIATAADAVQTALDVISTAADVVQTGLDVIAAAASAAAALVSENAAAGAVSTHAALTATHGIAGAILGDTDVQTITGKSFDDELRLKEIAAPAAAASGYQDVFIDTADKKAKKIDSAGVISDLGGGAGSLDTFLAEDFSSTTASDFTQGLLSAPIAAGGGTFGGTLSDDTSTNISGDTSLKYVAGATSTNDFFIIDTDIPVDVKQVENHMGVTFYYKYDGSDDDIKLIILDQDDLILTDSLDVLKAKTTATRFSTSFFVPSGTTGLRYGFQVVTGVNTKILIVDDIEISTNPFVYKDLIDADVIVTGEGNAGEVITNAVTPIPFIEVLDEDSAWDGSEFTAPRTGYYNIKGSLFVTAVTSSRIETYINGTISKTIGEPDSGSTIVLFDGTELLQEGDVLGLRMAVGRTLSNSPQHHWVHIHKVDKTTTEHVVTPASVNSEAISYQGFTSGTNPVVFKTASATNNGENLISATTSRITVLKDCMIHVQSNISSGGGVHAWQQIFHKNSADTILTATYTDLDNSTQFLGVGTSLHLKVSAGDYFIVAINGGTVDDNYNTNFSAIATPIESTFLAAVPWKETVAARYTDGSGQAVNNTNSVMTFATKSFDTHDAFSGTVYTVPFSGKYYISAECWIYGQAWVVSNYCALVIQKNGTDARTSYHYLSGGNHPVVPSISDTLDLVKGDTIEIDCFTSIASTLHTFNDFNVFTIHRIQ